MPQKGNKILDRLTREVSIQSNSFNEKDFTFDVVWSTGVAVKRYAVSYEFMEELSLDPEHVRLERLQTAPVLKDHYSWDHIGTVVRADIPTATVKLSKRDNVKDTIQDVKDGILRHISVGYRVFKYKDITKKSDSIKRFLAVDWEPLELSIVPMPADVGAKIRNLETKIERSDMPEEIIKPVELDTPQADVEAERKVAVEEAIKVEKKRFCDISLLCRKADMPELTDSFVKENKTVEQVRAIILEKIFQEQEKTSTRSNVSVTKDEGDTVREGITNVIEHRMLDEDVKEVGRKYAEKTLIELARDLNPNFAKLSKNDIAVRALSSSDFPELLANTANKTLQREYKLFPQTFQPFVHKTSRNDFKESAVIKMSEAPSLLEVKEDGTIQLGTVTEEAEKYSLATYARGMYFTRKAMTNDDLAGLIKVMKGFGRRAAQLESKLFWDIIFNNVNMADGNALFSAAHENDGTAGVPSLTTLNELAVLMGLQKDLDGSTPLNIKPTYILCPLSLQMDCLKLVGNINPNSSGDVNPYQNAYKVVSESRIDVNNDSIATDAWYLFSDTKHIEIVEMAYLKGRKAPQIISDVRGGVDGVRIDCIFDVAAKALDFRGVTRNIGV